VDLLRRNAEVLDPLDLRIDLLHDRLGLRRVGLHSLDLRRPQRLSDIVHLRKIRFHDSVSLLYFSFPA
jgi:hypothetical protein